MTLSTEYFKGKKINNQVKEVKYDIYITYMDIAIGLPDLSCVGRKMNSSPMSHTEACIFKSKLMATPTTDYRIVVAE